MSAKCPTCGFDEGHFVCAKAPIIENYNKAVRDKAALLEEIKEARTLLKHLVKFLKFQRPGKEFYPNREAGEACINRLENLIAQAESEAKP